MDAIVKKLPVKSGTKGKAINTNLFFDTGSPRTFVREDTARKLGNIVQLPNVIEFRGLSNGEFDTDKGLILFIKLDGIWCEQFAYVVKNEIIEDEILVGYDFMQVYKVKLDLDKEDLILDEKQLRRAQKIYLCRNTQTFGIM